MSARMRLMNAFRLTNEVKKLSLSIGISDKGHIKLHNITYVCREEFEAVVAHEYYTTWQY